MARFDWERVVRRYRADVLAPSGKFIALLLATYANADGTRVWPGEERLALAAGVTTRTVRTHLAHLRELGLITRTRRGNSRAGQSDQYRLTVPAGLAESGHLRPPGEDDDHDLSTSPETHFLSWDENDRKRASGEPSLITGSQEHDDRTPASAITGSQRPTTRSLPTNTRSELPRARHQLCSRHGVQYVPGSQCSSCAADQRALA